MKHRRQQRPAAKLRMAPRRTRELCLTLILLSCLSPAGFAQTITIRIVNLTNKKPVKNVLIYVSGITEKAADERDQGRRIVAKPIDAELRLPTGANGEASLSLPKPPPERFYIRASLSGPHWDCTCLVRVVTEEVMRSGLVVMSPYAHRRSERPIPPRPGEVFLGLKPTPWWVRVFWPVLKG
jgi:hypothetical protein